MDHHSDDGNSRFPKNPPLYERLTSGTPVTVCVIGLGYTGLPLALRVAEFGHFVKGVDISEEKIDKLKKCQSIVEGITENDLRNAFESNRFEIEAVERDPEDIDITTIEWLAQTEVFLVCVHTPLHKMDRSRPDTDWIERSARLIERVYRYEHLKENHPPERLVVLESTTYPGTTREIFADVVDKFSSRITTHLAYSPERTDPRPGAYEIENPRNPFNNTRVVGGKNNVSTRVARAFYEYGKSEPLYRNVHTVTSMEVAEFAKLYENTFRYLSIALAIEMSHIAGRNNLDIWEIIKAVKTKRFGLDVCVPGLVGGHCIPIDPIYLSWYATDKAFYPSALISYARSAHDDFLYEAFWLVCGVLNKKQKSISGATILFWGVTYKENVADIRESAARKLMNMLGKRGSQVCFWDPVIAKGPLGHRLSIELTEDDINDMFSDYNNDQIVHKNEGRYFEPIALKSLDDIDMNIVDCVVLAVNHEEFTGFYDRLVETDAPAVVDLCNSLGNYREELIYHGASADRIRRLTKKMSDHNSYQLLGRAFI